MASDKRVKVTLACIGVQAAQLQYHEEQEERPRPPGDEQVLPLLQEAHQPQGDPLRVRRSCPTWHNTAEKKNIFKRIGGFFVRLVKGIGRKFREMFYELKKVTWPTKKDMINYSVVVLVFIVIMGVIIGVIDLGAGKLVELLVS